MVRRQQPKTKQRRDEQVKSVKNKAAPGAATVGHPQLSPTESTPSPIPVTRRGKVVESPLSPRVGRSPRARQNKVRPSSPRNTGVPFTTDTSQPKKQVRSFRKTRHRSVNSSGAQTFQAFSHKSADAPRDPARDRPHALSPAKPDTRVRSRDGSSYDLPLNPLGGFDLEEISEITETSCYSLSGSQQLSRKSGKSSKRKLPRIVNSPSRNSGSRENLSRASLLSHYEKEIECARKLMLRSSSELALQKLNSQIQLINAQPERNSREQFACATAYYLKCRCHVTMSSWVEAEVNARHSLMELDVLIAVQEDESLPALTERKHSKYHSDNWLTGQDLSISYLWFRRSVVENQIAHILWEKERDMAAVQWLQRSIYSRETRGQAEGLADTYVKLSEILVTQARIYFDNLRRTLEEMILVDKHTVLWELENLLSVAQSYTKRGVGLCKKNAEDRFLLMTLYNYLDLLIIRSQLSGLQKDHLVVEPQLFYCKNFPSTCASRERKMEAIRQSIEKIQRRLNQKVAV